MKHKYIAVEGPIGVGKSTLATQLSRSLGYAFLGESAETNPYLENFYKHPAQFAFHVQVHFLLSRIEALTNLEQSNRMDGVVTDFILDKDRLFAANTLDDTEFAMYERLHQSVSGQLITPHLVIYLQAPPAVLLSRIKKRGLRFEQHIDSSYLQKLVDSYENYFHQYDASPLLVVNATEINIADNPLDYENLLNNIAEIGPGRHYLNPIAESAQ